MNYAIFSGFLADVLALRDLDLCPPQNAYDHFYIGPLLAHECQLFLGHQLWVEAWHKPPSEEQRPEMK